jgi:hypothetical protein
LHCIDPDDGRRAREICSFRPRGGFRSPAHFGARTADSAQERRLTSGPKSRARLEPESEETATHRSADSPCCDGPAYPQSPFTSEMLYTRIGPSPAVPDTLPSNDVDRLSGGDSGQELLRDCYRQATSSEIFLALIGYLREQLSEGRHESATRSSNSDVRPWHAVVAGPLRVESGGVHRHPPAP